MHVDTATPERFFERVFLLELTGPTLDFLDERSASLPHFRELLEDGARGRLLGPLQPVAPASFGTLFTGRNPGATGLYDFFQFPEGSYDRIPYDLTRLRTEPLFATLSRHGVEVGLLNTPLTHPLPDVKGFVVSGDEGIGDDFARPADVMRLLTDGGYTVPFGGSYAPGRELEFHEHVMRVLDMRLAAFRALFRERPWRFGMLTMHLFGELLHAFWRFYDPRHPGYRPREQVFGDVDPFLEVLSRLDELLGEVRGLIGGDGLLLVAGAWGHRLEHSKVHFNAFLEREGYLRFRGGLRARLKRSLANRGLTLGAAERLAHRLNVWKFFHYALPRGTRARLTGATFLSFADVDWSRTRAIAAGYLGQVFLNVKGRRPAGVIEPGDYAVERDRLRALLEGMTDPRSGVPIVERVFAREEIYSGEELHNAPDLLIHLREGWSGHTGIDAAVAPVEESPPNHSSDHCPESVFLAAGPGVRTGLLDVRLEDVAPTVLRALGVPVPDGLDGRPLPLYG